MLWQCSCYLFEILPDFEVSRLASMSIENHISCCFHQWCNYYNSKTHNSWCDRDINLEGLTLLRAYPAKMMSLTVAGTNTQILKMRGVSRLTKVKQINCSKVMFQKKKSLIPNLKSKSSPQIRHHLTCWWHVWLYCEETFLYVSRGVRIGPVRQH